MSDREIILRALDRIRRRLRLTRTLHDAAIVLAMAAVALLLWRVLVILDGQRPAMTALAVLAALLLWVAGVYGFWRAAFAARCSLASAAAEADANAGLKDELKTAYWFLEHPLPSPWVAAQLARAAATAARLDPARILPIRIERRVLIGSVAAGLLVVLVWLVPPLSPSSPAAAADSGLSESEARQVQLLRELIAQAGDEATAGKLEQALQTLERKDATEEERRRALAEARAAVEQQNLEAASTREGLYRLAQNLHGNRALDEVAKALEQGDARKAAGLLQRMASARGGRAVQQPGAAADARQKEKDLERLINDAAQGTDQPSQPEASSAAATEAVDRLNKIAEQLEVKAQLKPASQALQSLQLAVAQRSVLSAGRFSQSAAQNATPAPESGQTSMPGGTMYRAAAVARENKASAQQEGSKSGAAMGDSEADQVLGEKATPLAVQLKQEGLKGEPEDEAPGAPKSWFYAESKEQRSTLDAQDVRARSSFAQAESSASAGISIRHRRLVKEYFMQLPEGSQP